MKTIIIKHVDGVTDVRAKIHFGDEVNLEYKYEGMTYGRTIGISEAIGLGIIDCPHSSLYPIMGFDNVVTGEQCMDCGKIT